MKHIKFFHQKIRPQKCHKCPKDFVKKMSLERHMMKAHGDGQNGGANVQVRQMKNKKFEKVKIEKKDKSDEKKQEADIRPLIT